MWAFVWMLQGLVASAAGVYLNTPCIRSLLKCAPFQLSLSDGKFSNSFIEDPTTLNRQCRSISPLLECMQESVLRQCNLNISPAEKEFVKTRLFIAEVCKDVEYTQKVYLKNAGCINRERDWVIQACNPYDYVQLVNTSNLISLEGSCLFQKMLINCRRDAIHDKCGPDAADLYQRVKAVDMNLDFLCLESRDLRSPKFILDVVVNSYISLLLETLRPVLIMESSYLKDVVEEAPSPTDSWKIPQKRAKGPAYSVQGVTEYKWRRFGDIPPLETTTESSDEESDVDIIVDEEYFPLPSVATDPVAATCKDRSRDLEAVVAMDTVNVEDGAGLAVEDSGSNSDGIVETTGRDESILKRIDDFVSNPSADRTKLKGYFEDLVKITGSEVIQTRRDLSDKIGKDLAWTMLKLLALYTQKYEIENFNKTTSQTSIILQSLGLNASGAVQDATFGSENQEASIELDYGQETTTMYSNDLETTTEDLDSFQKRTLLYPSDGRTDADTESDAFIEETTALYSSDDLEATKTELDANKENIFDTSLPPETTLSNFGEESSYESDSPQSIASLLKRIENFVSNPSTDPIKIQGYLEDLVKISGSKEFKTRGDLPFKIGKDFAWTILKIYRLLSQEIQTENFSDETSTSDESDILQPLGLYASGAVQDATLDPESREASLELHYGQETTTMYSNDLETTTEDLDSFQKRTLLYPSDGRTDADTESDAFIEETTALYSSDDLEATKTELYANKESIVDTILPPESSYESGSPQSIVSNLKSFDDFVSNPSYDHVKIQEFLKDSVKIIGMKEFGTQRNFADEKLKDFAWTMLKLLALYTQKYEIENFNKTTSKTSHILQALGLNASGAVQDATLDSENQEASIELDYGQETTTMYSNDLETTTEDLDSFQKRTLLYPSDGRTDADTESDAFIEETTALYSSDDLEATRTELYANKESIVDTSLPPESTGANFDEESSYDSGSPQSIVSNLKRFDDFVSNPSMDRIKSNEFEEDFKKLKESKEIQSRRDLFDKIEKNYLWTLSRLLLFKVFTNKTENFGEESYHVGEIPPSVMSHFKRFEDFVSNPRNDRVKINEFIVNFLKIVLSEELLSRGDLRVKMFKDFSSTLLKLFWFYTPKIQAENFGDATPTSDASDIPQTPTIDASGVEEHASNAEDLETASAENGSSEDLERRNSEERGESRQSNDDLEKELDGFADSEVFRVVRELAAKFAPKEIERRSAVGLPPIDAETAAKVHDRLRNKELYYKHRSIFDLLMDELISMRKEMESKAAREDCAKTTEQPVTSLTTIKSIAELGVKLNYVLIGESYVPFEVGYANEERKTNLNLKIPKRKFKFYTSTPTEPSTSIDDSELSATEPSSEEQFSDDEMFSSSDFTCPAVSGNLTPAISRLLDPERRMKMEDCFSASEKSEGETELAGEDTPTNETPEEETNQEFRRSGDIEEQSEKVDSRNIDVETAIALKFYGDVLTELASIPPPQTPQDFELLGKRASALVDVYRNYWKAAASARKHELEFATRFHKRSSTVREDGEVEKFDMADGVGFNIGYRPESHIRVGMTFPKKDETVPKYILMGETVLPVELHFYHKNIHYIHYTKIDIPSRVVHLEDALLKPYFHPVDDQKRIVSHRSVASW